MRNYLEFERPVYELEQKISELKQFSSDQKQDLSDEIKKLNQKSEKILKEIYAKLTAPSAAQARELSEHWPALSAWREVLDIDYADDEALCQCQQLAAGL